MNETLILSLFQNRSNNFTFICPKPLVYAYDNQDQTVWAFEDGNCAVRRPPSCKYLLINI